MSSGHETAAGGEQLRVVVVEDHAFFRRAICESLEARGFAVCAELELGEAAPQAAIEHRPHVVLMDQRLPGISGPAATRLVLEVAPQTRVVAVSAFGAAADLRAALASGAAGYMLKSASPGELAAAVRAAAAGETPISPAVATHLVAYFYAAEAAQPDPPSLVPVELLSDREREILALMTAGHDNRTIAETLFISPHTVKGHVSMILSRLEVENRIQAAVYAARHGLD